MRLFAPVIVALVVGTIGCSHAPARKETPTGVSGKVSQGGRPVGDVMVSFQPLDHGHLCSFPVRTDGTFQGKLISGNYAYYVSQSTAPKSAVALKRIDPKYFSADLGRSVAVQAGHELAIALD